MRNEIHFLDVVALKEDNPELGLRQGQVGTVVEELGTSVYEIEFSDNSGRTYATAAFQADQVLVLHYELIDVGNA